MRDLIYAAQTYVQHTQLKHLYTTRTPPPMPSILLHAHTSQANTHPPPPTITKGAHIGTTALRGSLGSASPLAGCYFCWRECSQFL